MTYIHPRLDSQNEPKFSDCSIQYFGKFAFSMYEDAVHEVLDFVLALFLVFRHFFNLWALSFFSLTISYLKHSGC